MVRRAVEPDLAMITARAEPPFIDLETMVRRAVETDPQ